MAEHKAVEARIEGRVQGVSFRAWTQLEAKTRGLSGWVRNEPDGSVTALFAGQAEAVDDMLTAVQHGPPAAVVRAVEVHPATAPVQSGFDIRR